MFCTANKSCANLCCKFCDAENCIFRCYKDCSGCGEFKDKKIRVLKSVSEISLINPKLAPSGSKYSKKPTNAEFKEILLNVIKSQSQGKKETRTPLYNEEDIAEMKYWQEQYKPENRHSELSKVEIIEKISKYDVKFSTASKKEELRKLLVSLEDGGAEKKEEITTLTKGRKPRIDKEYRLKYGHLSKAELLKMAKSKKVDVLPTDTMNDIIKKIECKK